MTLTCNECKLTVSKFLDRYGRVPGHEVVWRTLESDVEVPHFLLHNPV